MFININFFIFSFLYFFALHTFHFYTLFINIKIEKLEYFTTIQLYTYIIIIIYNGGTSGKEGFPGGASGKEPACQCRRR